jgi:hypothetical protein
VELGFLKYVEGERRQRGEAASIGRELDVSARVKVICVRSEYSSLQNEDPGLAGLNNNASSTSHDRRPLIFIVLCDERDMIVEIDVHEESEFGF